MEQYPYFKDFNCVTQLNRINLDKMREDYVKHNKGFIIHSESSCGNIKKEIKNDEGIFSPKFGRNLADVDKFGTRYACSCRRTTDRINNGTICPYCGTKVKYVDDNFDYFGFLKLDDYYIIHPNLFKSIQYFIGSKRLDHILKYDDYKNRDGYSLAYNPRRTNDEPFYGIGMIEFMNRFDEIMNFYLAKNKNSKLNYYNDIMITNRDNIFTQTIPVFTTLLRAMKSDINTLKYEESNALYMMINKLVHTINMSSSKSLRSQKPKSELLYDLQMNIDELYDTIVALLSGKKGRLRATFGSRYNFTSRLVIVGNPQLRVDQIIIPYQALIELEKQRILNVLEKVHGSAAVASRIYGDAVRQKSPEVVSIIKQLIQDDVTGQGIPCLLNRNPTINYGSIQQIFVVGMCDNYTLEMSLQALQLLGADFDGDVLNILRILSRGFYEEAYKVFNPRNAMYISRNNGYMSEALLPYKDVLINANAMLDYTRKCMTPEEIQNNMTFMDKYNL